MPTTLSHPTQRSVYLLRWVACALAALAVLCGSPAKAQSTYTWSGASNSTWNTTSNNWTGAGSVWTGTNSAVFASTSPGTVTVSGSQAVTGISFTGTGFTLSSGTLWLASATTSITASQNATIGSIVAGANALLVDGSAILTLTGANTYSGGTTISSSSTLQIGNGSTSGAISSTGGVTNNGLLVFNRSNALTVSNAISGSGSVSQIGSGTLTLSGSNTYTGTTTVTRSTLQIGAGSTAGSISSSSALVLGGASLIMSRSGTVTQAFNGTTLNAGASVASSTNASITVNFGAITRNVGATLDLSTTGTFITSSANANGILGGWATVGGANWAVANGNSAITALSSYTNDTWASGNNTTITASGNVAASATTNSLRFNTAGANTLTLSGSATVASGGILVTPTVSNNASTITGGTLLGSSGGDLIVVQSNTAAPLTISSVIADNGSATGLTKSGAGTLVLGSNNTYTGTTAINGGTLQIGDGGATGAISLSSAITGGAAGGGGTLVFNRSNTVTQGTDFNTVIGGAINVSQLGSGTLVLGSNNTYTGTTSILGGVVQISSATNSLGNGSTGAVILNGGTLSPTWSGTQTQSWSFAIGSGGGTLLLAANQRLGGASQVSGSGTFTIQGQASSSGLYLVGGMNKNFSGFSGKVVINNAAVLYANNLLVATGTGADAVTLNNAYLTNLGNTSGANFGSSTLGIWLGTGTSLIAAQYSTTLLSALSGTATNSAVYFIPQNGSSAFLTLSNTANSYSADTYLGNYLNVNYSTGTFGGLRLGASNVLPNGVNKGNVYLYTGANPSAFVDANSTYFTNSASSLLDLNGYNETVNGLSSRNATTGTYSTNVFVDNMLASSTSTLTLGDGDATATFAGSIRNSGVGAILNLKKIGSGTQALSGSNSYAGTTGINAGTLLFTSTAALYSGSTASWTATNLTTGSGATAAFGVSGSSGFTSGNLDTLFGLGTGSTGFLPGSSFGIDTTGTTFTYASNIANPNSGANALGLVKLGSGTLTLSGSNTFSGGATVALGRLVVGSSNALGTGTAAVSGGVLDVGANAPSVAGFMITSGSLVGTGTITASTYGLQGGTLNAVLGSGAITVSTGTTTLGSGGRFNSASALTVQSGQLTLSGSESVASFVLSGGVLDGNGKSLTSAADYDVRSGSVLANLGGSVGLVKSTGGTVTLSGANTYSGATTIQSGTLVVGGANAIPGGSAITIGSSNSRGFLEVDHPLSISSLTFTGSGGDISDQSASTVTLWAGSGTATINVSSGSNYFHANATLSSPTVVDVANGAFFGFHNNLYGNGSASLTKSGSGTMELAGDNDQLQGNLFITGGRVNVGTGMNQIGTGTTTLSGWATIDLGGQSFTDRIVVINGTILNAGGTATTTTIAGISTIGGTTAQGTYDITSSGSALFNVAVGTGTSTVNVNVNSSGAGGGQASFESAVGAKGNIIVYAGGTATFGSTVAGAVTSHGASTFNGNLLSGANAEVRSGGSSTFNASTAAGSTVSVDAGGVATFAGEVVGQATINGSATFSSASGLAGLLYTGTTGSALLDNVAAAITGEIHNDGTLTVNRTSGSQTISGYLHGSGSLVKQGAGTLVLSGSSTFTGATTISGGVVSINGASALQSTSGVSIAGGAGLTYTGGAGSLDRDITVTGGVGTVTNSGAGRLTLAGTLTKNGTVLQLSGGAFNVTGQIVGTSANSDLYVNGASVTLSNTNSYNGPTFVFNSGTLALGVSNAIPSNSTVTLGASGTGSATGPGTLDLGTFTNTIAGLVFSGSGNTLKMAANQTAAPQLATNSSLSLGAGTTLDLTGMGTSAGLYKLVSYTSRTGTFGTVSGMAAGYQLVYGGTTLDAQQKAVLGTVTVTNPAVSIITGGSAAFTYTVANGAASGGASLSFTGSGNANVAGSSNGSAAAGGSSSSVAGLYFTGTGVGSGQTGTFNVNAPDAYGISTATGTVSVTVLDHATSSLSSASTPLTAMTINLGQWNYATHIWESGTGSGVFLIYNLASQYGANLTADLSLLGVTGSGNGFSTNLLDALATIAGGTSSEFSIFFNPTGLSASGTQSTTFAITTSDKTGMSGATASNTLYVTASVIVVPEPDTIIFAGIGIAMAGWSLWKRRRIAQILRRPAP